MDAIREEISEVRVIANDAHTKASVAEANYSSVKGTLDNHEQLDNSRFEQVNTKLDKLIEDQYKPAAFLALVLGIIEILKHIKL